MDQSISDTILAAVEDANKYPFLFMGSGLSRRYMGSPGWEKLLKQVCKTAFGNDFTYAGYRERARVAFRNKKVASELPYVATLMENDVNAALLLNNGFIKRHPDAIAAGSSPLKLLVADIVDSHSINADDECEMLACAGRNKVSGVITTNYDRMCETIFPDFAVFDDQDSLLFAEQGFSQEIYKIHGSVSSPDGMVLTAADYEEFEQKRKYVSAKLLTIFVEYPVIFLGYSIQDDNIKAILSDIAECLDADKLSRLEKRMIFVQRGEPTRIGNHSIAFGDKLISMTKIETEDFASVFEALLQTNKLYSTKLLRELRGSLFRLVEKIDPKSPIVVAGVNNTLNNLSEDQRVVVGIANSPVSVGKPISPEDIFQDVVLDNLRFDNKFIVENYLNSFVRQQPNNMPVFKYVRGLGKEVGKYIANYLPELSSIDAFRTNTIRRQFDSVRQKHAENLSVSGLVASQGRWGAFPLIPYLEENEIDIDNLGELLRETLEEDDVMPDGKPVLKNSSFRKCIRIYDYLRYRDEEAPNLHH